MNYEIKPYANLCSANLCGAKLCSVNLCGAKLCSADLRDADLRDANLCGANLRDADLRGANLRGANLRGANLRGANLCGANLRDADLRDADLRDADLCSVSLRSTIGNMKEVRSMQVSYWRITFTKDILAIGCQQHSIIEWKNFTNDQISNMHSNALEFWLAYKEIIFKLIELSFQTIGKQNEN